MLAIRSGPGWEVRAPAKLNLSFDILARRNDGYHEIESLMVPVGLFDTLIFVSRSANNDQSSGDSASSASAVTVSWQWASAKRRKRTLGDTPAEADNLVVRAVERLRLRAGEPHRPQMRLVKRIPTAAGLGGGSSDAAAARLLAAKPLGIELEPAATRRTWPRKSAATCRFFCSAARRHLPRPRRAGRTARGSEGPCTSCSCVRRWGCPPPPCTRVPRNVTRAARPWRRLVRRADLATRGTQNIGHNATRKAAESLTPWIGRLRGEFARVDCPGGIR